MKRKANDVYIASVYSTGVLLPVGYKPDVRQARRWVRDFGEVGQPYLLYRVEQRIEKHEVVETTLAIDNDPMPIIPEAEAEPCEKK